MHAVDEIEGIVHLVPPTGVIVARFVALYGHALREMSEEEVRMVGDAVEDWLADENAGLRDNIFRWLMDWLDRRLG